MPTKGLAALGPLVARRLASAETRESREQSAWDRGVLGASMAFHRPASAVGVVQAVIACLVGLVVGRIATNCLPLQLGIGAVTTVVSYWAVPTLWAMAIALHAPYVQRDDMRRAFGEAKDLKRLVLLERHLKSVQEGNMRTIEEVRSQGLAGPIGTDAFGNRDEPWVKGANEQMRLFLERHGFPELVKGLVLDDPPLNTWEEVDAAGWEIARRLQQVLWSDLFTEVKNLDRL